MSLRAFFRKLAGRAGKASHSMRGASSHVNTKANKRASSKAVRTCEYDFGYDPTFYEDHHLDPFAYDELPCLMRMDLDPADEHTQRVVRNAIKPKEKEQWD